MATEGRRRDHSLVDKLFKEPYRFAFFQAVRLLRRIFPDRASVGRDPSPNREVARFRTRVSLSFPPSQVHQLARDNYGDEERPPQMVVAFMGLTGPLGVLPTHYTETLIERVRYNDTAMWEFFDIFNHRMISFFYRGWEKYRFYVGYEQGDEDRFTEYLFDTVGMGTRGLRGRLSFNDQALIFYGGLIAQRPHSASAIEAILGDYFEVPVKIQQFTGQWINLEDENLTRLGRQNNELGMNTIAGTRVWDAQSKFRLRLGPLNYNQFIAFLPVGSAFQPLGEWTRYLAGLEYDFDVQPVLKAEEVPPCLLTTRARRRPRLGWTSWLKSRPFTDDDSQVILSAKN